MNKLISLAVVAYLLTGCTLMSSVKDSNNGIEYDIDNSSLPSGIFTYYNDPKQFQSAVEYFAIGKFLIRKDCLLFQLDNELYTPIFPAKFTKYTKGETQITVDNETFNIGETINVSALPVEREYIGNLITKGPSYCLLDKFMKIKVRDIKYK